MTHTPLPLEKKKYAYSEQYADNGAMDGYRIYKVEDGVQVGYAFDEEIAQEFVHACNAQDGLTLALQELMDAVPSQTNDRDWWPDELTRAMKNAALSLDKGEKE